MMLGRIGRSAAWVGILLAAACQPPEADGPAYDPCSAAAVDDACSRDQSRTGSYPAVDAMMEDFLEDNNVPGCAVGLTYGPDIVYVQGYGFADHQDREDLDDDVPYRIDTIQPVASISKTITGLTVLRLLADGRLSPDASLDTPLQELLPSVPETMAGKSLRQLLTHSSGFPNSTPYSSAYQSESTLRDLYPANQHPGMHPRIMWWGHKDDTADDVGIVNPGDGSYANTNFRVLASVIDFWTSHDDGPGCGDGVGGPAPTEWSAATTGQYYCGGYESTVRSILASPSVDESFRMPTMCLEAPWRYPELPTLATAYDFEPGSGTGSAAFDPRGIDSNVWTRTGSSGWMMTVGDLARLMLSIDQLSALDATSRADMLDPANATNVSLAGGAVQYALGTWLASQTLTATGLTENGFEHGGDVNGFSTWYRMIRPVNGPSVGVALLCNGAASPIPRAGMSSPSTLTLRRNLARALIDRVHQDFSAGGASPVTYDATGACTGEANAMSALMASWRDSLHFRWVGYLSQAGGDEEVAEQLVRRDLVAAPGGEDVLDAWDRGDMERAAALLKPILERGY